MKLDIDKIKKIKKEKEKYFIENFPSIHSIGVSANGIVVMSEEKIKNLPKEIDGIKIIQSISKAPVAQ